MHTHTGARPNIAYVTRGRMFGHSDARPGKVHALLAVGRDYVALCGERVKGRYEDDWNGDPITGHVLPAEDAGARKVTCKRCLRVIAG